MSSGDERAQECFTRVDLGRVRRHHQQDVKTHEDDVEPKEPPLEFRFVVSRLLNGVVPVPYDADCVVHKEGEPDHSGRRDEARTDV
jgi:hypothetical protein